MKKIRIILQTCLSVSVIAFGLSACNTPRGQGGNMSMSYQGNYRCTATNTKVGGNNAVGWSTDKSMARRNALDKCREFSKNPNGCHIVGCTDSA